MAALGLNRRLDDGPETVLVGGLEHQLGCDRLETFLVGELEELGVGDGLPDVRVGGGLFGLHGKAS